MSSRRVEVIWKPFLLVLSPSSHFNLSARPPPPLPPSPASRVSPWGEAPEFSDQRPCTTGRRGTQAHPRSLRCPPAAQEKKKKKKQQRRKREKSAGSETRIHMCCITHGSRPESRVESRSTARPAHSAAHRGSGPAPAWEKRGKQIFYPDKLAH